MSETPFPANARPAAPGPSIEEQLRKAVEEQHGGRQRAIHIGTIPAGGRFPDDMKSLAGGGVAAVRIPAVDRAHIVSTLPKANEIAMRLSRVLDRLRSIDSTAESIAVTLAGPSAALLSKGEDASRPPAASLFVIYERTLDEIDRIIDNIESEQARTRNILGE